MNKNELKKGILAIVALALVASFALVPAVVSADDYDSNLAFISPIIYYVLIAFLVIACVALVILICKKRV